MFAGIVVGMGRVLAVLPCGAAMCVEIGEHPLKQEEGFPGASIAVSGMCATVERVEGGRFFITVSSASLSVIVPYQVAQWVNLEPAVRVGQEMSYCLVSGHVDGLAVLEDRREWGAGGLQLCFSIVDALRTLIVQQGFVVINGVSVVVCQVDGCAFVVRIGAEVAHRTNLGSLSVGQPVNVEINVVTRYWMRCRAVMAAHRWAVG